MIPNILTSLKATHVTPDCLRTVYGTINYKPQVPGKNKVALTDYLGEVSIEILIAGGYNADILDSQIIGRILGSFSKSIDQRPSRPPIPLRLRSLRTEAIRRHPPQSSTSRVISMLRPLLALTTQRL